MAKNNEVALETQVSDPPANLGHQGRERGVAASWEGVTPAAWAVRLRLRPREKARGKRDPRFQRAQGEDFRGDGHQLGSGHGRTNQTVRTVALQRMAV